MRLLVVSDALLHAAQATQGAGEGALSHLGHASSAASVQLILALLMQADLLSLSECQKGEEDEDECGFHGLIDIILNISLDGNAQVVSTLKPG